MSVYLDYNATAPVAPQVLEQMVQVYTQYYGNADSRTHQEGAQALNLVESARAKVANLFHVEPHEVVFTSGATESNNLAILGMAKWGKQHGKTHIITSEIDHKAILEPLRSLEKEGFSVDYLKPDQGGKLSVDSVLSHLRPNTLMVCLMHANNETGVIQPVEEIGKHLAAKGVYFLVDAAQTSGKLVEELRRCEYDFLSCSAHKMYGPQGVGLLIVRRKNYAAPPLQPVLYGGGQEHGLRPGTTPVALVSGMGVAAELAANGYQMWQDQTGKVKRSLLRMLEQSGLPYSINGDQSSCMPNTLNVSFIGVDSEALMIAMKGVCSFSNGSACTARDYSPSYVLTAMNLSLDRIESAVRLSWSEDHTDEVISGFQTILETVGMQLN